MSLQEKLIIALDFPDFESCVSMVEKLGDEVSFYKIGLEMLTGGDYFKMIKYLKNNNKKIFADLKLYDIPNTVGRAIKNLAQYDVDLITIHAANPEIMDAAVQNRQNAKILAVTVLTCLEKQDLEEMGFDKGVSLDDLVLKKTKNAIDCGVDGVVASGLETQLLRQNLGGDFLIVTPGIRLKAQDDDQKRVCTAKSALNYGSNHLVIGRPITRNADPKGEIIRWKEKLS